MINEQLTLDSIWYQWTPKGEMYIVGEVLTEPPEEEGNDQRASEGTDEVRVSEHELEDAPELEDSENDESPDS